LREIEKLVFEHVEFLSRKFYEFHSGK
jgi:hypothetical protein